jgi:glycosyltransferase involved in cell wall biosynthesis
MATSVRSLLTDESRRRELGRLGREMQRRDLEWERLIDRYDDFYAVLADQRRASRG